VHDIALGGALGLFLDDFVRGDFFVDFDSHINSYVLYQLEEVVVTQWVVVVAVDTAITFTRDRSGGNTWNGGGSK
jgi:hypothetical protein